MKLLISISALLLTALCITGSQAKPGTSKTYFANITDHDLTATREQDTMRNKRHTPDNGRKSGRERNNVDSSRMPPYQRTDTAAIPPHRPDTIPGQMTPGKI